MAEKKKVLCITAAVMLAVLAAGAGTMRYLKAVNDDKLTVTSYEIGSRKLKEHWKIALLSDLHNHEFGTDNSRLVEKITLYEPDVVLILGDMVTWNDPDVSVALTLCDRLVELAPVYYLFGNHEGALEYGAEGPQVPLDGYLIKRGVTVCYGGTYTWQKGSDAIKMLALPVNYEEFRKNLTNRKVVQDFEKEDGFKLIASHYPDTLYRGVRTAEFDLGVAGHYHGGQVRLGDKGLYHHDTGPFPQYSGGLYQLEHGKLLISRGLGNNTVFPRINNDPELVFIDLKPEQ